MTFLPYPLLLKSSGYKPLFRCHSPEGRLALAEGAGVLLPDIRLKPDPSGTCAVRPERGTHRMICQANHARCKCRLRDGVNDPFDCVALRINSGSDTCPAWAFSPILTDGTVLAPQGRRQYVRRRTPSWRTVPGSAGENPAALRRRPFVAPRATQGDIIPDLSSNFGCSRYIFHIPQIQFQS